MARRILSEARCHVCWMRKEWCLCPDLPRLQTSTRLVILMHNSEFKSTTNTGRLAILALGGEIRVRGEKGNLLSTEGLREEGRQPLFLFPSEDAVELTPESAAEMKGPFTLIVPDGTWRQASKVGRREPGLAGIARVKLPAGRVSRYHLRRAPQPHCLSTLEAIARAYGALEGPHVQRALEGLFDLMVERTLKTRSPDSLRARGLEPPGRIVPTSAG